MVRDFKIYYNDSFVQVTSDRTQMNKKFATIFREEREIEKFFTHSEAFFDGKTNRNILAITTNAEKVMRNFRGQVKMIIAGGGIVFNEKDELLMIHRRGKWDLAKGKIEEEENIIDGAKREVEEETGVMIESVSDNPLITYHAYRLKGKNSLKATSWYEMKAKPNQFKLTPQVEEDIDEVRWVKKSDLQNYQQECYLLVWDLIKRYAV